VADIDVGASAVNRDSGVGAGYTFIDEYNPVNLSGTIDEIQIYMHLVGAGGNVTIGFFYDGGGTPGTDNFTCRSIVALTGLSLGLNIEAVSVAVVAGDFIGIYIPDGDSIDMAASGGIRRWTSTTTGNKCVAALTSEFSSIEQRILSLNGSGYTGSKYPSDTIARVSSIRHIFRPGMFRMQVGLGDLGLDIDVAEATVRKELDTAKETEEAPPTEPLYVGPGERGEPARPTRAEPITPFAFEVPEEIGVSAKVTAPPPAAPTPQLARETPSPAQMLTPWREEEGETFYGEITKGLNLLRERLRSVMRRGAQPNTCPICKQSFATATELQAHMRQRHGGM